MFVASSGTVFTRGFEESNLTIWGILLGLLTLLIALFAGQDNKAPLIEGLPASINSRGRTRTCDLRVMSPLKPLSCMILRDQYAWNKAESQL